VKATIQTILLAAFLGFAADTAKAQTTAIQNQEASEMERRWLAIWPERFAEDNKKHIGATVRFTTGPFTNISAGTLVTIKSKDGRLFEYRMYRRKLVMTSLLPTSRRQLSPSKGSSPRSMQATARYQSKQTKWT
jgi:hypothetical protein